jgi:hypothetical protein
MKGSTHVRAQAKRSSAANRDGSAIGGSGLGMRRGFFGLACLCALGLAAFLGSSAPAVAADNCPNAVFRTGPSANLPDCRAYELVSPENGGGIRPSGFSDTIGSELRFFETKLIAPSRESIAFFTKIGALPDTAGTGDGGDLYRAIRTDDGWTTRLLGPTAAQTEVPRVGSVSPDHEYYFLGHGANNNQGSLLTDFGDVDLLRLANGSFEPIAQGSLGIDPTPGGLLITPGASHVIFANHLPFAQPASFPQLEPLAAPTGRISIYDRTPGGVTKVVSLLPGDVALSDDAFYQGASADGSVVLFKVGNAQTSPLYARVDNADTYEVAGAADLAGNYTCLAGPASAATKRFQWLRNGAVISGATSSSYTAVPADAGAVVQCQAFALNANAGSTQVSNPGIVVDPPPGTPPPVAPGSIAQPGESAALTVGGPGGQTLTCAPDTWTGVTDPFAYQWYRNGVALAGNGANTDTYTVQVADVATRAVFQCAVTGTNAGGSVVKVSSNRDTSPAPSPAAPVATATTSNASILSAGASANGDHVFYVIAGNIFSFDTNTQATTQITDTNDTQLDVIGPAQTQTQLVNVSADGSRVYFVSLAQLDGGEGTAGQANLYVWERAADTITHVATLDPAEVAHDFGRRAITRWTDAVVPSVASPSSSSDPNPGFALSRATPDGSAIIFESRTQLTAYDNDGHSQIYRYETATDTLVCVSCGSGSGPATGDAMLMRMGNQFDQTAPLYRQLAPANLASDGETVVFETEEALSVRDTNGEVDVYRWKDGDLALISTGRNPSDSYLYAVSQNGEDIVFITTERLVPDDLNTVGALYTARVNGGFAPAPSDTTCAGDACQGDPTPPPAVPGAGSSSFSGPGNRVSSPGKGCGRFSSQAQRKLRAARKAKGMKAQKLRKQARNLKRRAKSCNRRQAS